MPITTIREAREEVTNFFIAAWNAQVSPPIILFDDKERDAPDNDDYVRFTMHHNIRDRQTLGDETNNRRFRSFGIITVQVFTISGDGLETQDAYVDLAVKAFEGQKTGEDRVTFRNVSHQEISQDGPWHQTNVLAEFDYDFIR